MKLFFSSLVMALALGCGSKAAPPSATPGNSGGAAATAPAVETDCADLERQTELCRPTCEYCTGDAPGNSCNVCAEACAQRIWCAECGATEGCD